jgi:hypothetical protein
LLWSTQADAAAWLVPAAWAACGRVHWLGCVSRRWRAGLLPAMTHTLQPMVLQPWCVVACGETHIPTSGISIAAVQQSG